MTRGAKIVVFSIVGLFVLAGMYFTFFAPPVETQPLADTTPTVSESTTLTLTPGTSGVQDPNALAFGTVADPTLAPASGAFPSITDQAFAPASLPADNFQAPNQFPGAAPAIGTVPVIAPAPAFPVIADSNAGFPATVTPEPVKKVVEKAAPKTNYTSYTVVSGDTLSSIAGVWFRDTSKWQLIADINPGLKPTTLKVGQKINLPAKEGKSATKTASASKSTAKPTAANEHVVASGETLASISDKAYGNRSNWKRIYEANKGVIGSDPSRLKVGMKLTIPSKS